MATPPLRVPVPSVVAPSLNVTVPLAALGETVEVKVTLEPKVEGFTLAARESVVGVLLGVVNVKLLSCDIPAPVNPVAVRVPVSPGAMAQFPLAVKVPVLARLLFAEVPEPPEREKDAAGAAANAIL